MNSENTNKLYAAGPSLYSERDLPETATCMCWGFECYDTWFAILLMLTEALESINTANAEAGVRVVAEQVKEKFGTLRFYYRIDGLSNLSARDADALSSMVSSLIDHAEDQTKHICAQCGKVGPTKPTPGWITYLCPDCMAKWGELHGMTADTMPD